MLLWDVMSGHDEFAHGSQPPSDITSTYLLLIYLGPLRGSQQELAHTWSIWSPCCQLEFESMVRPYFLRMIRDSDGKPEYESGSTVTGHPSCLWVREVVGRLFKAD